MNHKKEKDIRCSICNKKIRLRSKRCSICSNLYARMRKTNPNKSESELNKICAQWNKTNKDTRFGMGCKAKYIKSILPPIVLLKMTTFQRLAAKQKAAKLKRIDNYYVYNPGCSIKDAVRLIPESQALVQQYSKLRTKYVKDGVQDKVTDEQILNFVYGVN